MALVRRCPSCTPWRQRFHDITTGSNANANGGFSAGVGYDLVTGRGTPFANLIARDLVDAPGNITGTVYRDFNGNTTRWREVGFAGWTVYIDSNNSGTFNAGEPTTVTNVSGGYSFTGLAAGSYRLTTPRPAAIRQWAQHIHRNAGVIQRRVRQSQLRRCADQRYLWSGVSRCDSNGVADAAKRAWRDAHLQHANNMAATTTNRSPMQRIVAIPDNSATGASSTSVSAESSAP